MMDCEKDIFSVDDGLCGDTPTTCSLCQGFAVHNTVPVLDTDVIFTVSKSGKYLAIVSPTTPAQSFSTGEFHPSEDPILIRIYSTPDYTEIVTIEAYSPGNFQLATVLFFDEPAYYNFLAVFYITNVPETVYHIWDWTTYPPYLQIWKEGTLGKDSAEHVYEISSMGLFVSDVDDPVDVHLPLVQSGFTNNLLVELNMCYIRITPAGSFSPSTNSMPEEIKNGGMNRVAGYGMDEQYVYVVMEDGQLLYGYPPLKSMKHVRIGNMANLTVTLVHEVFTSFSVESQQPLEYTLMLMSVNASGQFVSFISHLVLDTLLDTFPIDSFSVTWLPWANEVDYVLADPYASRVPGLSGEVLIGTVHVGNQAEKSLLTYGVYSGVMGYRMQLQYNCSLAAVPQKIEQNTVEVPSQLHHWDPIRGLFYGLAMNSTGSVVTGLVETSFTFPEEPHYCGLCLTYPNVGWCGYEDEGATCMKGGKSRSYAASGLHCPLSMSWINSPALCPIVNLTGEISPRYVPSHLNENLNLGINLIPPMLPKVTYSVCLNLRMAL
eukprot:Lithocolla_globosa_v1_NODE_5_length_12010_cov_23.451945.p3 type:complete len:546 gc:universal NODE_5_length_12010_cov_23.451945:6948-5311(-)